MATQAKSSAKKNEQKQATKPASTAVAPANPAPAPQGALVGKGAPMVMVQADVPDYIKQDSNRGSENVGTEDLVIPRLEVLQALSPELDPQKPEFIKGASQGDLINSVTRQNYGREVFIVPIHYSKQYLVWIDRRVGGGFRGSFPNPDEANDRKVAVMKEEQKSDEQVQVIDTPVHFCLLINRDAGSADEIILSMPRTKAKVSRAWNSMIRLAGGDRFSRVYRVTTQSETNPKGTFQNFAIAQSGFPVKPLYDKALAVYEQIASGNGPRRAMDVSGYDVEQDGGGEAEM
jgi:hypothetical protein